MKCSPNEEEKAIDLAVETIARANDDQLTHSLVEYLMGEADGMPKVSWCCLDRLTVCDIYINTLNTISLFCLCTVIELLIAPIWSRIN